MRSRMSVPEPAERSRFAVLISGVPLVTFTVLLICMGVYVADNMFDFSANTSAYSISAFYVIWEWQWYRIVSCAFTHLGILHIIMNGFATYQLGSNLEPMFGTLQYLFIMIVFILMVGVGFIVINLLLSLVWPVYLVQSESDYNSESAVFHRHLKPVVPFRQVLQDFQVLSLQWRSMSRAFHRHLRGLFSASLAFLRGFILGCSCFSFKS